MVSKPISVKLRPLTVTEKRSPP